MRTTCSIYNAAISREISSHALLFCQHGVVAGCPILASWSPSSRCCKSQIAARILGRIVAVVLPQSSGSAAAFHASILSYYEFCCRCAGLHTDSWWTQQAIGALGGCFCCPRFFVPISHACSWMPFRFRALQHLCSCCMALASRLSTCTGRSVLLANVWVASGTAIHRCCL